MRLPPRPAPPTVMIFGPTLDRALGAFPPNVRILRRGLPCEPCWFRAHFSACAGRIDCLAELKLNAVIEALHDPRFADTYLLNLVQ